MLDYHNPLGKSDYVSIQHVERYRFALDLLKTGSRVLDVACGVGYGSKLLEESGAKVFGGDINEENLIYALKTINCPSLVRMDARHLPFHDNSFEVIISFETIEHFREGDDFLQEVHRVLRPDGIFICSTPNIKYTSHPPFHLKEYGPEEFYEKISSKFNYCKELGQYFKVQDRIKDIFFWYIYRPAADFFKRFNGIESAKGLSNRFFKKRRSMICPGVSIDLVNRIKPDTMNNAYKVQPVKTISFLRIMIAVALK